MEIEPICENEVELSPWKREVSQQFKHTTGRAVPVMEGYLPGAAKNRLSINEGEQTESTRRQREASMRESTQRRQSAAKGESRRFSFMSSSAEFNKLLIESQQNSQKSDKEGKKRMPRVNKRDRLSSGTFSQMDNNKHALLSTYINSEHSHCGKTGLYLMLGFGTLFFVLGYVLGMGILPMMLDEMTKKQLMVSPDSACFSPKDGGMCPGSVKAKYFLWNITNANEYLQGSEPPHLEEVGPFVYNSYEKVYNAQFSLNKTMVNYDYTYFWNFSTPDSCKTCQSPEDMQIYTVNSAYLQVLNQGGGSETSLIMAFLPQIFDNLFEGLKSVVSTSTGMNASDPGINSQIFGQWANCSVLNDTASSLTAYQENDPYVPEVGAWKRSNVDNTSFTSGISVEVAKRIFGKQESVAADDPFPDPLSFIGAMMMMPEPAFSAASGISEAQIATLKGYIYYVIGTYGKMLLTAVVGPPLEENSTGLIIKRTAKELLEGWQDPLMASFMPGMNMSYNLGFHTDLIETIDQQISSGVLDSSHPFVFAKETFTGKYKPSEIGNIISFGGLQEIQYGNGTGKVYGKSMDPSTGFRFYNFRKEENFTIFHEGASRPLNFLRDEKDSEVHKIDTMHFVLDPNSRATCSANETQCIYPDNIDGVWNVSSVYMAESVGSFPQWDPQGGVQLKFNEENRREWGFDIEPTAGIALRTVWPFQYNYKVGPTDQLHENIWTGGSSSEGTWIPQFYYDLMIEISPEDALKLRKLLNVLKIVTLCLLCVLPTIGIIMIVYSTFKLFFSLETIKKNKELQEKGKTRASTVKVNRESFLKKDLEKQSLSRGDPLNRHHYSFTSTTKVPKNSLNLQ